MIDSGVKAGERIVVSDPIPAVAGMLLNPVPDEALQARILNAARGEE